MKKGGPNDAAREKVTLGRARSVSAPKRSLRGDTPSTISDTTDPQLESPRKEDLESSSNSLTPIEEIKQQLSQISLNGKIILNLTFQYLYYILDNTQNLPDPSIQELRNLEDPYKSFLKTRKGQLLLALVSTPAFCVLFPEASEAQDGKIKKNEKQLADEAFAKRQISLRHAQVCTNIFLDTNHRPQIPEDLSQAIPFYAKPKDYFSHNQKDQSVEITSGVHTPFQSNDTVLNNFVKILALLIEISKTILACNEVRHLASQNDDIFTYSDSAAQIRFLLNSIKKLCEELANCRTALTTPIAERIKGFKPKTADIKPIEKIPTDIHWITNVGKILAILRHQYQPCPDDPSKCIAQSNTPHEYKQDNDNKSVCIGIPNKNQTTADKISDCIRIIGIINDNLSKIETTTPRNQKKDDRYKFVNATAQLTKHIDQFLDPSPQIPHSPSQQKESAGSPRGEDLEEKLSTAEKRGLLARFRSTSERRFSKQPKGGADHEKAEAISHPVESASDGAQKETTAEKQDKFAKGRSLSVKVLPHQFVTRDEELSTNKGTLKSLFGRIRTGSTSAAPAESKIDKKQGANSPTGDKASSPRDNTTNETPTSPSSSKRGLLGLSRNRTDSAADAPAESKIGKKQGASSPTGERAASPREETAPAAGVDNRSIKTGDMKKKWADRESQEGTSGSPFLSRSGKISPRSTVKKSGAAIEGAPDSSSTTPQSPSLAKRESPRSAGSGIISKLIGTSTHKVATGVPFSTEPYDPTPPEQPASSSSTSQQTLPPAKKANSELSGSGTISKLTGTPSSPKDQQKPKSPEDHKVATGVSFSTPYDPTTSEKLASSSSKRSSQIFDARQDFVPTSSPPTERKPSGSTSASPRNGNSSDRPPPPKTAPALPTQSSSTPETATANSGIPAPQAGTGNKAVPQTGVITSTAAANPSPSPRIENTDVKGKAGASVQSPRAASPTPPPRVDKKEETKPAIASSATTDPPKVVPTSTSPRAEIKQDKEPEKPPVVKTVSTSGTSEQSPRAASPTPPPRVDKKEEAKPLIASGTATDPPKVVSTSTSPRAEIKQDKEPEKHSAAAPAKSDSQQKKESADKDASSPRAEVTSDISSETAGVDKRSIKRKDMMAFWEKGSNSPSASRRSGAIEPPATSPRQVPSSLVAPTSVATKDTGTNSTAPAQKSAVPASSEKLSDLNLKKPHEPLKNNEEVTSATDKTSSTTPAKKETPTPAASVKPPEALPSSPRSVSETVTSLTQDPPATSNKLADAPTKLETPPAAVSVKPPEVVASSPRPEPGKESTLKNDSATTRVTKGSEQPKEPEKSQKLITDVTVAGTPPEELVSEKPPAKTAPADPLVLSGRPRAGTGPDKSNAVKKPPVPRPVPVGAKVDPNVLARVSGAKSPPSSPPVSPRSSQATASDSKFEKKREEVSVAQPPEVPKEIPASSSTSPREAAVSASQTDAASNKTLASNGTTGSASGNKPTQETHKSSSEQQQKKSEVTTNHTGNNTSGSDSTATAATHQQDEHTHGIDENKQKASVPQHESGSNLPDKTTSSSPLISRLQREALRDQYKGGGPSALATVARKTTLTAIGPNTSKQRPTPATTQPRQSLEEILAEAEKLDKRDNQPISPAPSAALPKTHLEFFQKIKSTTDKSAKLYNDENISEIQMALADNPDISIVLLQNNNIGPRGGFRLCRTLLDHKKLTTLFMSNNPTLFNEITKDTEDHKEGLIGHACIQAFSNKLIARHTSLKHLMIDECGLGTFGAIFLANGLKQNETLRSLDLRYNEIGDEGIKRICEALSNHKSIESISVSGNQLTNVGGEALLSLLRTNKNIITLEFWEDADSFDPTREEKIENSFSPEVTGALKAAIESNQKSAGRSIQKK